MRRVYAEQDIGFWLSYTLPTVILCLAPFVMWWGKNKYHKQAPGGSVFLTAIRLLRFATKKAASNKQMSFWKNIRSRSFWDNVKPSTLEKAGETKPKWMTFDDSKLLALQ